MAVQARAEIPADPTIWFAAAKLEEAHGESKMAAQIIKAAPKSLRRWNGVVSRDDWLKVCQLLMPCYAVTADFSRHPSCPRPQHEFREVSQPYVKSRALLSSSLQRSRCRAAGNVRNFRHSL